MKATKGYNKKTKCNFLTVAADATVGPTIKVKTLDNATFLFQWLEFLKAGNLGTNGVMQAADDATGYF